MKRRQHIEHIQHTTRNTNGAVWRLERMRIVCGQNSIRFGRAPFWVELQTRHLLRCTRASWSPYEFRVESRGVSSICRLCMFKVWLWDSDGCRRAVRVYASDGVRCLFDAALGRTEKRTVSPVNHPGAHSSLSNIYFDSCPDERHTQRPHNIEHIVLLYIHMISCTYRGGAGGLFILYMR